MEELRNKIMQFVEDRNWGQFHSPVNLAKSIIIEAAELLELFQWDEDNVDYERVKEELADIIIYSIQLADKYNFDVKQIILNKIKMNEERYPIEKSRGTAKKYNKL